MGPAGRVAPSVLDRVSKVLEAKKNTIDAHERVKSPIELFFSARISLVTRTQTRRLPSKKLGLSW